MKHTINKTTKKTLSMQTQLFFSYTVVLLAIVFVFATVFYFYTSQILIAREKENLSGIMKTFIESMEEKIKEMDDVSVDVVYSNIAQKQLNNVFQIKPESSWEQYSEISKLAELFVAINGVRLPVDQMNLYDYNGNVVRVGFINAIENGVDVTKKEWYQETCTANGYKYITQPYSMSSLMPHVSAVHYYISLLRIYQGRYGSGVIETVRDFTDLFSEYAAFEDAGGQMIVLRNDGEIFYAADFLHDLNAELLRSDADRITIDDRSYIKLKQYSGYTGFDYIILKPEEVVLAPVEPLKMLVFVTAILCIGVTMLVSFVISKRFTAPIKRLNDIIGKTELNSLGKPEVFEASFDEMKQLHDQFEQMSVKLKQSVNELVETRRQALKSKNLALQAQMNPHFYYNTLANIIALCNGGKTDEAVQMCRYMTEMMRYVVAKEQDVTLAQEANYVSQYLYCMKVRYPSSLHYEVLIPETMKQIALPRLVIQPLVENAVKYGANAEPPWVIEVIGKIDENGWKVTVRDSGEGFSEESIKIIKKRMDEADASIGFPDIQMDGMGLLNAYLRFTLYYHETAIFEFGNQENGGGFVSIGEKYNGTGK